MSKFKTTITHTQCKMDNVNCKIKPDQNLFKVFKFGDWEKNFSK